MTHERDILRSRQRKVKLTSLTLGALLTLTLGANSAPATAEPAEHEQFDTILRNGTIFDGSGAPRFHGDVGISSRHITAVGDLTGATASRVIDATGLFVAPGFINMHSHASPAELPVAQNMLTQGITTEFLYPDGGGPVDPWRNLQQFEDAGLAVNIGSFVGFGAVWSNVVGQEDRRPTPEETAQMRGMVERAMSEGAWGVTTNLDSAPQTFASTQEVVEVAKGAHGWRANYQSHLRSEGTSVVEALQEAIQIGEEAGLVPLWTHAKAEGPSNWGKSAESVRVMDQAMARGTYVAGDVYPYLAGQSSLARRFIPRWAAEGGFDAMLERFANPELRPTIAAEAEALITERVGGPHNILIRAGQYTNWYLDDIAQDLGVGTGEAVMRIVEAQGSDLSMNYWYGHEDDLVRILEYPTIAGGCDCGATVSETTHPRNYGSFPKFLGEYVRERNVLTHEEMIRKMTGLPATEMGLVDRGFIAEGMVADITVFDPETVIDRATFEEPRQYSEGIEYVFVNGRSAVDQGEVTGAQAGQVLWRTPHMPARPESSDHDVSVAARGVLIAEDAGPGRRPIRVAFSVSQDAGGPTQASGNFELLDLRNRERLESVSIGALQATDHWASFSGTGEGWASFTGVGRLSSGAEVPFLVVVEEADPVHPDAKATVTVHIADREPISGSIRPGRSVNVTLD